MVPANFNESNCVFDKPEGIDSEICGPLNAYVEEGDQEQVPYTICCWKLTRAEVSDLLRTGRIWIYHLGPGLQPHVLSCDNPFKQDR